MASAAFGWGGIFIVLAAQWHVLSPAFNVIVLLLVTQIFVRSGSGTIRKGKGSSDRVHNSRCKAEGITHTTYFIPTLQSARTRVQRSLIG